MIKALETAAVVLLLWSSSAQAQIKRIWLTHGSNDPQSMVVNWMTEQPGDSIVRFGPTDSYGESVRIEEKTKLHHVTIPRQPDTISHYSVSSGDQHSSDAVIKAVPSDVLRVAVVADWQGKPDLTAIRKEDVHLLLTAGDNIPNLWQKCGEGTRDCVTPYADLIDAYPDLFRTTPCLPALGNHDREMRPRGKQPPAEPVYDVEATAFRQFFELPDEEWKWHFDLPGFDLRFIALDFNHISDFGTTWQTCHAFDENSEQFRWYSKLMKQPPGFVVTLYNERNSSIRNKAGGKWNALFRRGTCCITGFGYFAERADVEGFSYYNTSLSGKGNKYPDPQSKFLASEDSYILLTAERGGKLTVEIKNLAGTVLDRKAYGRRKDQPE